MKASELIEELQSAIEEHGDLDVLVHADDGWNYAVSGSIEKIYDKEGRQDFNEEQKGNFNSLVMSL